MLPRVRAFAIGRCGCVRELGPPDEDADNTRCRIPQCTPSLPIEILRNDLADEPAGARESHVDREHRLVPARAHDHLVAALDTPALQCKVDLSNTIGTWVGNI